MITRLGYMVGIEVESQMNKTFQLLSCLIMLRSAARRNCVAKSNT